MTVELFISYTHKDRELQEELANHLSSLRNLGIINDWFDGEITAGTEWERQLFSHLDTAQIILLLISPDFIASKFCYQIEMNQALDRHNANQARVIPIILRPTLWTKLPFAKLQALPTDGHAVSLWPNRDAAFLNIVKGIEKAIKDLQKSSSQTVDNGEKSPEQAQQQTSVIQPSANPVHTNKSIGSVGGRKNLVIQAETITHYFGIPGEHNQTQPPRRKRHQKNSQ